MPLPRLLTLMGSGETAPTMVKVHRDLIDRLGGPGTAAVVLDTPYGFQENAPELAQRAIEYFRVSVGRPIEVAGLQRFEGADAVALEQGLTRVRQAAYVFAGPGSPTYSLRQWRGTTVPSMLADKLATGGAVTFASAAALTLGRVTVPVYEVYKAGADPFWLDGLDVLAAIGLRVAVIPHYDNTEGGHHDTRFCYLGERRLAMLERELPDGVHVLGVDEHTGVVLDLDADTATVVGNGTLTVRVQGRSTVHPAGTVLPIDALRHPDRAHRPTAGTTDDSAAAAGSPPADSGVPATPLVSLAGEASALDERFTAALADGDADGAVRAALELESVIRAWSADTLQSDEADRAHGILRSMFVRLGEAAVGGLRDPRELLHPSISLILDLRTAVRADKRYDLSDLIRDRLAEQGIEVRDTAAGPEWLLKAAG